MRDAGQEGFTLVEMLVSLALLGVAAALLAAGFASGRGVWARVEAHAVTGQDVSAAQMLLRDRLEQLYPATRYQGAVPVVDMEGAADRLDLLTRSANGGVAGEVRRERLDLTPAGELDLSSVAASAASAPDPQTRVLLRRVTRLDVAYFGAPTASVARGWRRDWALATVPPELIRVQVGFAPGDRRIWPELIVRPAATVDTQCVLDPSSGGCRGRA